jgi:hypothetical protein
MELFQLVEGLQGLSPDAQVFFIVCFFVVVMYLITLVTFYPDAARRIKGIVKDWQHWQGNKRRDNEHWEGGK